MADSDGVTKRTLTTQEAFDCGLIWAINRVLMHPQGYALAMDPQSGEITIWGDGDEPWEFQGIDEKAKMEAFRALLASVTPQA